VRFLVDQNISPRTTQFLRSLGHDALDTRDLSLEEAPDEVLLQIAREQHRILVTFDKDFTDIRDYPTDYGPGVIVLRTRSATSKTVSALLTQLLDRYRPAQLEGNLIIISETRIRIRPYLRLMQDE